MIEGIWTVIAVTLGCLVVAVASLTLMLGLASIIILVCNLVIGRGELNEK